jgi:RNA polymerase sigma-70 factor, ECF subfamily
MTIRTEQETIALAAAGDHQAFRVLVESHQSFVYSIAVRFVRNEAEAEDLTQEAFIRLWKNLKRYNPEFRLKTWLGKIVTNLALDQLKSGQTQNEKKRVKIHDELNAMSKQNPEAELQAAELLQLILQYSEQLTPKQRAVFVLRDLEQLEVSEVCEMLAMSSGTMKSNLYYARLWMKEQIIKYYKV